MSWSLDAGASGVLQIPSIFAGCSDTDLRVLTESRYAIAERLAESRVTKVAFCVIKEAKIKETKDMKGKKVSLDDILATAIINLAQSDDSFSDYLAQSQPEGDSYDYNKLWNTLANYYRKGNKKRAVILVNIPRLNEEKDHGRLGKILRPFDRECRISFVVVADTPPTNTRGFQKLEASEVSTMDNEIMGDDRARLIHYRCSQSIDLKFSPEFQEEIEDTVGNRSECLLSTH